MDEYLETLRIRAAEGDAAAAQELQQAIAYRQKQQEAVQRMASNLRADGVDVNYRKDGGIEVNAPTGATTTATADDDEDDEDEAPMTTNKPTSSTSTGRSSSNDRIRRARRKAKLRKGAVMGGTPRDSFQAKQDAAHGAIAKGASNLHLYLGIALAWLKTFFQKSILSVVAMLILLVGILLAAEAYNVSSGALPGPVLPKPGVPFSAAADTITQINATFGFWEWFWVVCGAVIALVVQALQWASVKFIAARCRVGSTGGTLALKGFSLIVFAIFCGFLWWQDLQIISGLYLVGGFSLGGLLVWAWSCFPSEISESIFALQHSLPNED